MAPNFTLPTTIIGPADLSVLRRNLEAFNDRVHQAGLRAQKGVHEEVAAPVRSIIDLAAINKADLRSPDDRKALLEGVDHMLTSAPTVTMSFAAEPSAVFMTKIVQWMRANIHPQLLVRVGLQPNIAAGCTLRTSSRVYDMSLRNKFNEKRPLLIERVRASAAKQAPAPVPATEKAA